MDYDSLIAAHPEAHRRVLCLDAGGRRLWVKRAGKNHHNDLQRVLGAIGQFFTYGGRRSAAYQMQQEIRCLEAVRARGLLVPDVVHVGADYAVLSDMGPSLQMLMREQGEEGRLALAGDAARVMARLHRAGGWHGCMMLRNMTLDARGIAMLDFESHLVSRLPMALRRANDMIRLADSMLEFEHSARLIRHAWRCYRGAMRAA